MPEVIHMLFTMVIGLILTVTGLAYWISRPVKPPRFADILSATVDVNDREGLPKKTVELREKKVVIDPQHKKWGKKKASDVLVEPSLPAPRENMVHEDIYRAYDTGKPLGEVAQIVNMTKGEVELILNLRKHRNQGA